MLFLVNDFMDIAQFDQNKIVLNMDQTVSIKKLIKECLDILRFRAVAKKIDLLSEVREDFPEYVKLDFNRVKQILINLVSNAIKYTVKGYVKVTAKVADQTVKLVVKDTGTGIDPSKFGEIFTAFTKIMLNRELNQEGVGLGLTGSRKMARAMGGDIIVKSTLNEGSKFTGTFPLVLESPETPPQNRTSSQKQLLIREQEENLFKMIKKDSDR